MQSSLRNLVPEERFELSRFYPADFESAASTIPPLREEMLIISCFLKKARDCNILLTWKALHAGVKEE